MQFRLSLLLFLVYAPLGAMWPLFPCHLDTLQFSPLQIALVCATQALGAIFGPLVAGQIADRWLPPERCLSGCAFAAGGVFLLLPSCTTVATVFASSLTIWLLVTPAATLGNAIAFTHLSGPEREFGRVRMWGTIGWVLQSWLVGYALGHPEWLGQLLVHFRPESPRPVLADMFRVAAVLEFCLGLYALSIPATQPRPGAASLLAPLAALRLLRHRSFAIFFLCNLLLCLTIPFSSQNTPLLLRDLGVGDEWAGPALTAGQSTEIVTLGLLPWILTRWGLRSVLLTGAMAWAASLSVQTVGSPAELVVPSLALNGVYITCFIIAGQVCVNSEAGAEIRVSAQALISCSAGVGALLGYGLSGWVRHLAGGAFQPTFAVAMVLAWGAVAILAIGFRR